MSKPKIKWLDRRVSAPGPYLCLCLTEDEFEAAMKQLKVRPEVDWIRTPQSNATAHFVNSAGGFACVVCMRDHEKRPLVEVVGLLVHEAVHAWQEWCDYYGENAPGREQEAYAIQGISQELIAEYQRRTAP